MTLENFEFDSFLSYSAKDKAVVRDIAEPLRKDEMKVWFDEWEIKLGDTIPSKIEERPERSCVLVLCMSANAFGSDWAQLEAGTFRFRDPLNKERRFLPVRVDDAPIINVRSCNSCTSTGCRKPATRNMRPTQSGQRCLRHSKNRNPSP